MKNGKGKLWYSFKYTQKSTKQNYTEPHFNNGGQKEQHPNIFVNLRELSSCSSRCHVDQYRKNCWQERTEREQWVKDTFKAAAQREQSALAEIIEKCAGGLEHLWRLGSKV